MLREESAGDRHFRAGRRLPSQSCCKTGTTFAGLPGMPNYMRGDTHDHQRLLENHRDRVLEILGKYGLANPRLFGSVLHATHNPQSDIDLLVDPSSETTLLMLIAAEQEIQTELGLSVDLKTPEELSKRFREKVISESRSLIDWQSGETSTHMSPQLRDGDYLNHIQRAIEKVRRYSSDREEFFRREEIQDAVIRGLEIIGEAVTRLSQDLKDAHPDVPWQQISGLRNRLIHGYFDVQLDLVWKTVQEDVPGFEQAVSKIAASLAGR
jgi:uncharacterized protein with HEPN domain/predicted nucleotidyltransferase